MHSPTVTVKPASPDFVYFVGVTIVQKVMSNRNLRLCASITLHRFQEIRRHW